MLLALLASAASGVAMTVQAAVNAALGKPIGLAATTFLVHATGLVFSGMVLAGAGSFRHLAGVAGVPLWLWSGGLLGVFIIFTMAFTVSRLGAGLAVAVAVSAQLIAALVLDHFGWLGVPRMSVTWVRAVGVALLVAGAWMVKASG